MLQTNLKFFFLAGLSSWAPLEDCGHDLNSEVEPLVPGGLKLLTAALALPRWFCGRRATQQRTPTRL